MNRIDFRPGSGGTEGICCIMKLTISFWLILISPTNQESMNQRGPFAQTGKQWVASDKTHCKPFDLGNLSSGYSDRPMDANHTPSLEYTLLGRGLFFNSEVSSF